MKRVSTSFYLVIIGIVVVISSCATLTTSTYTSINIYTDPDSALVCLPSGDSAHAPLILDVERGKEDLILQVKDDGVCQDVLIKSKLSPEFLYGNLFFAYLAPAGWLADAIMKRGLYTYDGSVLIDLNNPEKPLSKYPDSRTGSIYLTASLPVFDFMSFNLENGRQYGTDRFFGLQLGLDYYIGGRSYASFSFGKNGVLDFFIIPMDIWFDDTISNVSSYSSQLMYNFDLLQNSNSIMKLSFGAGLGLSYFDYELKAYDTISHNYVHYYDLQKMMLGFSFNAKIRLHKYVYVAYTYLPSVYSLDQKNFEFASQSYIEFGLSIPIRERYHEPENLLFYRKE